MWCAVTQREKENLFKILPMLSLILIVLFVAVLKLFWFDRRVIRFVCTCVQIFDSELEFLADYNGFNDWLHSFPLYRGKKTSEDDDDDHRIVGKFKVLSKSRNKLIF